MSYWLRGEDSERVDMQPDTKRHRHSYVSVACRKEEEKERRIWVLLSSAGHTATQLHMLRNWRNLLCSNIFTIFVYEDVMRLHSVLIEWGDDINMKQLWFSHVCLFHIDTSSCLVGHLTCTGLHWLNHWGKKHVAQLLTACYKERYQVGVWSVSFYSF